MIEQYNWQQFPTNGYVTAKFDDDTQKTLLEHVYETVGDVNHIEANTSLAGHIKDEFFLPKKTVELIQDDLFSLVLAHDHHFAWWSYQLQQYYLKGDPVVKTMWVNLQKKYEFNPAHTHDGIMSFVIWLDVPYSIEEEHKLYTTSSSKTNGVFEFIVPDSVGAIRTVPILADKDLNGTICMFPSTTTHVVYPFFTSNGTRITISGNIGTKND